MSEAGKLALDQLRVLRASYARSLPDKLENLKTLWQTLRTQNEPYTRALDSLRMEVHRLAGSGASYGYTRLSGVMQTIEQKLDQWRDFPEDSASIVVELDRLIASLDRYGHPDDEPEVEVAASVPKNLSRPERLSMVLLAPETGQATTLRTLMAQFGFTLSLVHDPGNIQSLVDLRPDLLVIEHSCFSAGLVEKLRQSLDTLPYIIVLVPNPSLIQRVELYRRGVMTVLPWPVDCAQLIMEIENCFGDLREVPFRVLLVDDDVELGLYYAQVLSSAGMLTRVTSDPWDVEAALEEFRPDVILMDLYMPEVNGIELAHAIRQDPACFGIPIIFASVEKDIVRHIGPIRAGGDDFLVKPVPVPFLIASVVT
ncbi:MAG: response regulator, partial [Gammaproteobacteria bacterium]